MLVKLDSIKNRTLKRVLEHLFYIILLFVLIPGFLYFELCIVLPVVVENKSTQVIHMCVAFFLLLNIMGNMVYGMLTDSSIKGKQLSYVNNADWTLCSVCECFRPPRAWHCDICNICILKRDHHCTYLTSCVGYFNYRYFLLFTLDIFISMMYAFYYNVLFIAKFISWNHGLAILKFIFPLASFVVDFGNESLYILMFVINILVGFFSGFLVYYHLNNVLRGQTTPERKQRTKEYNRGLKRNIVEVFGTRWYLTWVLPFINSPLPGNGVQWHIEDKVK
ncbi:probable palmitoyltransferase ZDHHC24 [Choristoneura fumiferana]|uniref:probable palmitoyltransferase ZDHHC24 n=1 Tax=Choristoneura fumiferana TaxID=7141 RepID=UPI003D159C71